MFHLQRCENRLRFERVAVVVEYYWVVSTDDTDLMMTVAAGHNNRCELLLDELGFGVPPS